MNKPIIRTVFISITFVFLLALLAMPALAQEGELRLNLRKSFGYSSGFASGNLKLQGVMTLSASGPADLQRVAFFLDETSLGEAVQEPFRLNFSTDGYSQGKHTLYAVGYTAGGRELTSNQIMAEFVTAEAGWQDAMRIIGPLFALIVIVMVVASVGPLLMDRGKKSRVSLGAERKYGAFGGSICPKCKRPFPLHFYGLNMLTHKLDLCPHCRRWSFVRPLPLSELRAAEQAELEMAGEAPRISTTTEEEKLRKELEDSRFDRS
jgi:hypothetical protein